MNHEFEQSRRSSTTPQVAKYRDTVEPGRLSLSAMLRKPDHALASGLVQYKLRDPARSPEAHDEARPNDLHGLALRGISGSVTTLPFLDQIQRAFGGHDVSSIQAHIGGAAIEACEGMGAKAYATGNHVAFREAPDLHTAAHEAAHVVQQRAGVQLRGGVGDAGDSYERNADQVADAVVAGQSAEALLIGSGRHTQLGAERRSRCAALPAMTADDFNFQFDAAATTEAAPSPPSGAVQRKCATCGTLGTESGSCPSCSDKAKSGPPSGIVRAHHQVPVLLPPEHRTRLMAGSQPELVSMLGAGRELTEVERSLFPGWQSALGGVRVHDDQQTQLMLALVGDHGFAAGGHVALAGDVSGAPEYKHLLAHEITHVVQQRNPVQARRSHDPESEAEQFAERVAQGDTSATQIWPGSAPAGLAEKVIARYTHDIPGNLLLVLDVDDGDFVGGCVRANAPHVGAKLIKKGVPKGVGNQLFNLHVGAITNAKGQACLFIYESVTGFCEMQCLPTWEEIKQRLGELRDWIKEKIEQILKFVLPVAIAAVVAYIIADLIVGAIVAAGILVAA